MMSLAQKQQLSHVLLLASQVCFSGWHIVGSLTMKEGANPFIFVLYREIISSFLMYLIIRIKGEKINIDQRDYFKFFFLGICSFINVVGAMLALNYVSANRFAIFQPCIPCIATSVSIFIGMEKMTILKSIGIAFAVGGAITAEAWVTGNSSSDADKNIGIGCGIIAAQVFAMSLLVVYSKPMVSQYPPAVVTLVYYSIGTVLTAILFSGFAFEFTKQDLIFHALPLPWIALAYACVFATVYNYNALSWAGRWLAPSTSTVYITFQPVGTILLSWIILGQIVTVSEGLGAALVAIGLMTTIWAQRREQLAAQSLKAYVMIDEEAHENYTPLAKATSSRSLLDDDKSSDDMNTPCSN